MAGFAAFFRVFLAYTRGAMDGLAAPGALVRAAILFRHRNRIASRSIMLTLVAISRTTENRPQPSHCVAQQMDRHNVCQRFSDKWCAENWRHRAEEARVHGEQLTDSEAKRMMLEIVASYDKLAKRAQKRQLSTGENSK